MPLTKQNYSFEPLLFSEIFENLEDPRDAQRTYYPLIEILFLLISANLCGIEDLTVVQAFGEQKLKWLRRFFPYKKGTPSHDTLGRILGMLDKGTFEKCFVQWVAAHFKMQPEELINLDGKRLSGSADKADQSKAKDAGGKYAEVIVNAFASGCSWVLAQRNVTDDLNEVRGALELLDWLEIEDCCITADSNFCARHVIRKIIDKKADYVLALKGKSPKLHAATMEAFDQLDLEKNTFTTQESGYGRTEKRVYHSLPADVLDTALTESYHALQQLVQVKRFRRINRTAKQQLETHYYITSLADPVEQLAAKIRGHWLIENRLHWVLDVEFSEDASRKRNANLATNASLIRKVSLNLLRKNPGNESLKTKRMKCAVSDDYRENILGFA
jgi:predicted transposase YbfD/YdcC